MITIEGQYDSYILDLNNSMESHRELYINSNFNGRNISWIVDYVSNPIVEAHAFSRNGLSIDVNLEELKEECYIYLKNLMNEKIVITIKPNIEASREKNYVFKLGKHTIDGKTITFNVISKENGINEPWSVVYNGIPLTYDIKKTKTKVAFTLLTTLFNEYTSTIILGQDNSNNKIRIMLKHLDNDTVELVEYKEAD